MRYKLNNEHVDLLRSLPETGMGSQHVDVQFADGAMLINATVFNCQELESLEDIDVNLIRNIRLTISPR
jgi:hypothetical protein